MTDSNTPNTPNTPHTPAPTDPTPEEVYLWDPGAEPDPTVAEIERRLAPLAARVSPLLLPRRSRPWARPFLLAAAVILAVSAALYFLASRTPSRIGPWAITSHTGSFSVAGERLKETTLALVTTGAGAKIVLSDGAGRTIHVQPKSLIELGDNAYTVTLLQAEIFLETAAAIEPTSIALGSVTDRLVVSPEAAASITYGPDGAIRATLKSGHARYFRGKQPEIRVPAEAILAMDSPQGAVAPYYYDAPKPLIDGLHSLQLAWGKSPKAPSADDAIAVILKSARPRDAMTLWNLLPRVGPEARARIAARLTQLAPEAAKSAGPGLREADTEAMEEWWRAVFPAR